MKLIVGLGNPDSKYQGTRHNVGWLVVDKLATDKNLTWAFNKNFNAFMAKSLDYYLVKPNTYMNNSGVAVQKIMNYYHLLPQDKDHKTIARSNVVDSLTVIHDDLDIALGAYKISTGGSSGGHNGVQSIIEKIATPNFTRVRLGLAGPLLNRARQSIFPGAVARFVLKRLTKEEVSLLNEAINQALKAIT